MTKKISGVGYYSDALKKHVYVCFWETATKKYVTIEGFKSREVDNLFKIDKNGYLICAILVKEIEKTMKEIIFN